MGGEDASAAAAASAGAPTGADAPGPLAQALLEEKKRMKVLDPFF